MKKTLSNHLINRLKETFEGEPWYGISLMEKLNELDFRKVNDRPVALTNSVARLVKHMINWRVFVLKKLRGNTDFDIQLDSPEDWPHINIRNEKEWITLLEELKQTQQKLITEIELLDETSLARKVPGKSYTYLYLVEGIIQHDVYHLGQISLVAKQAYNI